MKILYPDPSLEIIEASTAYGGIIAQRLLFLAPTVTIEVQSGTLFNQSNFDYAQLSESGGSTTSQNIDFDFGADHTVDYIFLGRIDWYLAKSDGDVTITVQGSTTDTFSTTEDESFTIGADDLVDKHGMHYVEGLTFASDYRYYRVNFSSPTATALKIDKCWIGQAFDFGYDPQQVTTQNYSYKAFQKTEKSEHSLFFPKVSKTIRQNFENEIARYSHIANIVLWDDDRCYFLDTDVYYCHLLDVVAEVDANDQYDMTLKVEDVL